MHILVIARRELVERRLALWAALYVSLAGWALPFLKSFKGTQASDAREVLAIGLCLAFAFSMAAILGAGMIPRDLEERRFGFYLSRPLSPAAILGGKLLAALVITVGGGLLVLAPQVLWLGWEAWGSWIWLLPTLFGGSCLLLALFHIFAFAGRAQSPWIILDMAALSLFGLVLFLAPRTLLLHAALKGLFLLLGGMAAGLLGILGMAVYHQVAQGGVDFRKGHRALSLTLMVGCVSVCLAALAFTGWALGGSPRSLTTFSIQTTAPQGDWLALRGTGRLGLEKVFLLNARTGASLSLGRAVGPCQFSRDGKRVVWLREARQMQGTFWCLEMADLGATQPKVRPVPGLFWESSRNAPTLALSPEADRIAICTQDTLYLHGLDTGQAFPSHRNTLTWPLLAFVSRDRLRLYRDGNARPMNATADLRCSIQELEVATGRWSTTASLEDSTRFAALDASSNRVLTRLEGQGALRDGRTGALLAAISGVHKGGESALFLTGGGFVFLQRSETQTSLQVLDGAGRVTWSTQVQGGPNSRVALNGETSPGHLLITVFGGAAGAPDQGRTLQLDLTQHTLTPVAAGVIAQAYSLEFGELTRPGAVQTRLFYDRDHRLSLRDESGSHHGLLSNAAWHRFPRQAPVDPLP